MRALYVSCPLSTPQTPEALKKGETKSKVTGQEKSVRGEKERAVQNMEGLKEKKNHRYAIFYDSKLNYV